MSHTESKGVNGSGPGHVVVEDADEKAFQELWLTLSRRDWTSMVLVPANPGGSAERVAHALAEVGKRLSSNPVTAVTPSSLEYGTAMALAELPSFVGRRRLDARNSWPTIDFVPSPVEEGPGDRVEPPQEAAPVGQAMVLNSSARLIISVPAVVSEPLGLATTQAADTVLLCVELGRTRLNDVRRTLKLIGRERVAGCLLVR
jgi:hypothetical protein